MADRLKIPRGRQTIRSWRYDHWNEWQEIVAHPAVAIRGQAEYGARPIGSRLFFGARRSRQD